jgi:hypothetical protein
VRHGIFFSPRDSLGTSAHRRQRSTPIQEMKSFAKASVGCLADQTLDSRDVRGRRSGDRLADWALVGTYATHGMREAAPQSKPS